MNNFKLILFLLCVVFLSSCNTKPKIVSTGIVNLEKKQELLIVNESNKNDVLSLLGETLLINYLNENLWTYTETQEQTNFLGKKNLIKNNFLFLLFDNRGILTDKKIYNLKDINEIEFSNKTTETYGLNKSIVSRFLYGIRKRYEKRQSEN